MPISCVPALRRADANFFGQSRAVQFSASLLRFANHWKMITLPAAVLRQEEELKGELLALDGARTGGPRSVSRTKSGT
jgi:hypothetical protein